jgi:hypothetical protein
MRVYLFSAPVTLLFGQCGLLPSMTARGKLVYRGAWRNHRPGVATDLITKLNATPYFQHAISLSIWAQLRLRLQLLKR